jgi:hypothetical protein
MKQTAMPKWVQFITAVIAVLVIVVFCFAIVIGTPEWFGFLFSSDAERIKQTEELLGAARRYPVGRFPRDETVPGYLWGISDNCWTFLQQRVAANAEKPVISIARKSNDGRWHWVRVLFIDASWIEMPYYQGLLSPLCETGMP